MRLAWHCLATVTWPCFRTEAKVNLQMSCLGQKKKKRHWFNELYVIPTAQRYHFWPLVRSSVCRLIHLPDPDSELPLRLGVFNILDGSPVFVVDLPQPHQRIFWTLQCRQDTLMMIVQDRQAYFRLRIIFWGHIFFVKRFRFTVPPWFLITGYCVEYYFFVGLYFGTGSNEICRFKYCSWMTAASFNVTVFHMKSWKIKNRNKSQCKSFTTVRSIFQMIKST